MEFENLPRWLRLGLVLNLSIIVWRIWVSANLMITLLPFRTFPDWVSDPPMYLIFYGMGFVGLHMAVNGDRRPLLFWDVVYLALIVPLTRPVWISGAVIAAIATYIGHRRMRLEHQASEARLPT